MQIKALNPYPWILENPEIENAERVLQKKNPERSVVPFVYVSVIRIFLRKLRSVMVPKIAYIFVQHRIFPHILAYAI